MTPVTLTLSDDLIARAAKAAAEGVPPEIMLTRFLEDALADDELYELDEAEKRAIAEGDADMKAGRWVSHDDVLRALGP